MKVHNLAVACVNAHNILTPEQMIQIQLGLSVPEDLPS